MSRPFFGALALLLGIASTVTPAFAKDCWLVKNFSGYSAHSSDDYRFVENKAGQPILICFTVEGGTVTGLDVPVIKFGQSTLAGYGGNDKGNEMFVVYQLDRERGKMLYMQTRIGTKTVVPILPDVLHAFVGDAIRAED